MDDAACKGKPTSWWFPGPGESKRKAMEICDGCPVRTQCADYALRTKTMYGIWGGRILRRSEPQHPDFYGDDVDYDDYDEDIYDNLDITEIREFWGTLYEDATPDMAESH